MAMIYLSPDLYYDAFKQPLDLRKFDIATLATAGLSLLESGGRLHLATMSPSTPAAKLKECQTCMKGVWLIKIGNVNVSTIKEAKSAFQFIHNSRSTSTTLLFAHPEVRPNLSHDGLPIISSAHFTQATHDQLNNRWEFSTVADHIGSCRPSHSTVKSGGVHNVITKVMKLTRGKLLKGPDWDEWQSSEYLQLNQYHTQGMFGTPLLVDEDAAVSHTVWTYGIKALDACKKAHMVCNGSLRAVQAHVLDKTYANCVDETSSCMFYAIAAAENLLVNGADLSNAFAKTPPPKQDFYIYPDRAFNEWWVRPHLLRPPLVPGQIIPILSTMQGHPESPRLWERHADSILQDIGMKPTVHEPCLYSGVINGKRTLLK